MIRIDSGNDISSVDNDDVTNECNSKTAVILIIWTGELFAKNTHLKRNEEKKEKQLWFGLYERGNCVKETKK